MSRLSKRSGCYPDCLILSDVERTGEHPVAGGGFADVWRGNSGGRLVALKALRIYGKPCREATFKEFCHEATIWRQLVHPNILPFYGVFKGDDSFDRLCLVSPWMDAGNVSTYLATHPNADRISLLADVTKGLDYLHFFVTPIVHGDLKGANIFVTSSLTACLGDFGLSHFKDSVDSTSGSTSGHATGTLRWQAPELFQRNCDGQDTRPSRESDSYSFGCVCLELMTDRPPFSEIRTDFAALAAIMEAKTPERPSAEFAHRGLDDSLWAVIEKCWNRDPRLRPTSKDLVAHFNVRINGPPQLLLSDINVQEMGAFCRLREGIMGEKTFQPLAVTHPAGNASTYANGVSAIYQLPVPNRQSAHWLMSFPTSEVDTDLSPILGTPVLKKRKNDGRSDISPPSKRISTGSKLGNVIVTTYSRQSDSNATAEGVC
ncbi:kinase-like protein [Rickenella mellea]|uniref:Kinase-like protein n=1 Tax=Rickenella mellea TaxID=50990 RepID=A0A4Y7PJJ4_9AGAM|nr:kinase-like protein [Rickenella mellea]